MIRVVLDTNLLVSAIVKPDSVPGNVFTLLLQEKFNLMISEFILAELQRVLAYKLNVDSALVANRLDDLRQFAELVIPAEPAFTDIPPEDILVVGTAIAGFANLLVTGDKKLLKLNHKYEFRIIGPKEFVTILTNGY